MQKKKKKILDKSFLSLPVQKQFVQNITAVCEKINSKRKNHGRISRNSIKGHRRRVSYYSIFLP